MSSISLTMLTILADHILDRVAKSSPSPSNFSGLMMDFRMKKTKPLSFFRQLPEEQESVKRIFDEYALSSISQPRFEYKGKYIAR